MRPDINTFDFHVHTCLSDGDPDQSPETVCRQAVESDIRCLSITDHDTLLPEPQRRELEARHRLTLVPGCEISCLYIPPYSTNEVVVHLGAHWLKPDDPDIQSIVDHNSDQAYDLRVEKMLEKCSLQGILPVEADIGDCLDWIKAENPDSTHLGKRAVAKFLVSNGYIATRNEAYALLAYGGPAYVDPLEDLRFVSFEEAVEVISRNSLCTLNHIYYSRLSDAGNHDLLRRFKACGGQALEVIYTRYLQEPDKIRQLSRFGEDYGLLMNCGSDRHDVSRPFLRGPGNLYNKLLERQLELHGTTHT